MKNKRLGFTLVEIMIVVAIIVVVMTIAIPNFLKSRVIATEAVALTNCRAVNNACQLYHINNEEYPGSLSNLIEPDSNPSYIDAVLATGRKQSYEFVYVRVDTGHFTLNANPTSMGLLKSRYFYLDETGIVRANSSEPAGPNDAIVF
ncbi:MAG: prepilin-type N-terminal cleavage/methylation domain-containing protein [Candidatus Omnitrophota bacterium]|nr:prepilin-type N-terminal cleavage/methylation domain-containing protein [Candidatus Omnitrophota bacterium]